MKFLRDIKFFLLWSVFIGICTFDANNSTIATVDFIVYGKDTLSDVNEAESPGASLKDSIIITDVYATAYYCIYNSEIAGFQTITRTISNNTYTLKASFLFGGFGVAMQGTGRTDPQGDYIKYIGGGGCFIHITGPNAGRNLNGRWVENPQVLRGRYAHIGITDFTGFGNLALAYPDQANFSCSSLTSGSTGRTLEPWHSIAVDPSLIHLGQNYTLLFKNGTTTPHGSTFANCKAEDVGSVVKGKRIDIYLGEGESAWKQWIQTGGNRYVDIYQPQTDLP